MCFIGGSARKERKTLTQGAQRRTAQRRNRRERGLALRQGEDEEIALAGDDDGEGGAIGRNGEIAEAKAVKNGAGLRLRNWNFLAGGRRGEGRKRDPDKITGFFFDGALEEDTRFVWRPAKDAKANAKARNMIGRSDVANFKDFLVDEISDLFPAWGDAEAAFVAVERGEFLILVAEKVQALQARRTGQGVILFHGDSEILVLQPRDVAKG